MAPYILITPAYNEESFIERTLQSVLGQKTLPECWLVVNDGSTDRTAAIVQRYKNRFPRLELLNIPRSPGRSFEHKARAFNQGWARVQGLDFHYVGNLDADISLDACYFEKLLAAAEADPALGLMGGMVLTNIAGRFVSQDVSLDSVAGAVQLFRRQCLQELGGYLCLPHGGIDSAAEITARMKGWKVRTFPELRAFEHRRTGTAAAHSLRACLNDGRRLYSLGYSLLFYLCRCAYRSLERPRMIGSAAGLYGYLASYLQGEPIVLPGQTVQFLRAEQRQKLLRLVIRSHGSHG
jgi:poly-beta-1,6-N-acetyl-D-glucosamine synthase